MSKYQQKKKELDELFDKCQITYTEYLNTRDNLEWRRTVKVAMYCLIGIAAFSFAIDLIVWAVQ